MRLSRMMVYYPDSLISSMGGGGAGGRILIGASGCYCHEAKVKEEKDPLEYTNASCASFAFWFVRDHCCTGRGFEVPRPSIPSGIWDRLTPFA